jgi:hypothetical protein
VEASIAEPSSQLFTDGLQCGWELQLTENDLRDGPEDAKLGRTLRMLGGSVMGGLVALLDVESKR